MNGLGKSRCLATTETDWYDEDTAKEGEMPGKVETIQCHKVEGHKGDHAYEDQFGRGVLWFSRCPAINPEHHVYCSFEENHDRVIHVNTNNDILTTWTTPKKITVK